MQPQFVREPLVASYNAHVALLYFMSSSRASQPCTCECVCVCVFGDGGRGNETVVGEREKNGISLQNVLIQQFRISTNYNK